MKLNVILFLFTAVVLHAEDWTTSDGKTYKGISVVSHDDGFVVILDADGGARLPLRLLPAPLQARFGFDSAKAKAAEAKAAEDDRQNAVALEKESETVQQRQRDELETEKSKAKQKSDEQAFIANAQERLVKVIQVLPDGILCEPQHIEQDAPAVSYMQSVGLGGGGVVPGRQYRIGDGKIVFIQINPQGFTEGQQTSLLVNTIGTFTYTDSNQASRTVEKWIVAPTLTVVQ